jgi:hypothetical protein
MLCVGRGGRTVVVACGLGEWGLQQLLGGPPRLGPSNTIGPPPIGPVTHQLGHPRVGQQPIRGRFVDIVRYTFPFCHQARDRARVSVCVCVSVCLCVCVCVGVLVCPLTRGWLTRIRIHSVVLHKSCVDYLSIIMCTLELWFTIDLAEGNVYIMVAPSVTYQQYALCCTSTIIREPLYIDVAVAASSNPHRK